MHNPESELLLVEGMRSRARNVLVELVRRPNGHARM